MYQGNWKCSSCGGAITELPFQPRSESGLTCRTCFMQSKGGGSRRSAPAPTPDEYAGGAEAPDFGDFPDEAGLATEPPPAPDFDGAVATTPGEKPRFSGDWHCATCGGSISSLPFQPRSTDNLKCIECFKQSRA